MVRRAKTNEPLVAVAASADVPRLPAEFDSLAQQRLERVNERIEKALKDNQKKESVVVVLCVVLFLTGLGLFIAGYVIRERLLIASGAIVNTGIIWPIGRILAIRKENIQLSVITDITSLLPAAERTRVLSDWVRDWVSNAKAGRKKSSSQEP